MKNILIFGDSNTWGWNPENTFTKIQRYPIDVRWTGVMQKELGKEYRVIDEGLNGRTTVWDDPIEEFRCGKQQLIPLLDSHAPLDLVIIFLGTNDLKFRYELTAQDISLGAGLLVQKTLQRAFAFENMTPEILLVAPPPTGPLTGSVFEQMFIGSEVTSLGFAKEYKEIASIYGVEFFNAGDYIKSSKKDGIHLDKEAHQILGSEMAKKVKAILE